MTATVNGIEIETLLRWGKSKEVETKNGSRILRKARPDEAFWELWNANQGALRSMGISVSKDLSEQWEVCLWQVLDAAEVERRAKSLENSRAVAADIVVPAPEGCAYRPYQLAGIRYALEREGTYFADEMGLGKTIEAIGTVNAMPSAHRVLVVTKASLKIQWHRELSTWLTRKMTVGIADSKCFPSTDVVIINWDIVGKFSKCQEFMWDVVILDEAHYAKNRKAKRTRAVVGYKPSKKELAEGVQSQSGIPAHRRLALSGTPLENCVMELFPVLNYLAPDKFPSRWKFESQFFYGGNNGFGWKTEGVKDWDKLQRYLRETCVLRRLKKDVLTDLPPKTRIIVSLGTEGMEQVLKEERDVQARHDRTLVEAQADYELAKCVEDDEFKKAIGNLRQRCAVAFDEMAAVRHKDALAKVPLVIEEIEADIEERGNAKSLVFAHHADVLAKLHAHFPKSVLYSGAEQDQSKRQALVDKFQRDPHCGPFFGSIRAAGEGLNLTAASLVGFAEEDWVPSKMLQCEDRCLTGETLVWYLRSDIMGLTQIKNIEVGDCVLTHLGNFKRVSKVASHEHRGMMTRVNYLGWCEPIVCTHDHKFYVKRDCQRQWVEAHDLLPTDAMAFPKIKTWKELKQVEIKSGWRLYETGIKPTVCHCGESVYARGLCKGHYRELLKQNVRPPKPETVNSRYVRLPDKIEIDDEWLYLFGWYVAEGFSSLDEGKSKFVSFSGHQKERFILEKIAKKINALGIKSTIYEQKASLGIEMRAYSGELAFWFRDWFGHKAANKNLPPEIMQLPPKQASSFLRGYTDGDGYQRNSQVEWVTASETLCYQMCLLAIRAGFIPTMRRSSVASGFHWVGGYTKFGKGNARQNDQDCEYIYRPIRSVETYLDKVRVYDLTVEDDHSFTTGFASAHNCHRIGQRDNVLVKHWVVPGTMDANMAAACVSKQNEADAALDDKPELDEPQLVRKWKPLATRRQIEIEASVVTVEQADACWQCVAELSNLRVCDGVEAVICQQLSSMTRLDNRHAVLARKLSLRHRDLLDARTVKKCGGWQGPEKRQ